VQKKTRKGIYAWLRPLGEGSQTVVRHEWSGLLLLLVSVALAVTPLHPRGNFLLKAEDTGMAIEGFLERRTNLCIMAQHAH